MRTVARISLAMVCCGLAIPTAADAKVRQSPTEIVFDGGDSQSIDGTVQSPSKRCVRNRTLGLYQLGSDIPFQTITASRAGGFSIALNDIPSATSGFRVVAEEARVGNRLCEDATMGVAADQATLSGGPSGGAFRGALTSSVDACEPGRVIALYEISSDPVFVGSNFTDEAGAWTIAQAGGTYEARADALFVEAGGVFTYCHALVSPSWTFEEPSET